MRTIAIVNQKGGCGKTITAINLSAFLAKAGRHVLLIDMDPQGHATLGLMNDSSRIQKTIYDALTPEHPATAMRDIIIPVSENLHLAPSDILLAALPEELAGTTGQENRLFETLALNETQRDYDYIIIDCPPSVGSLTFNALKVSSEVIIPVEPSFFSLHGIGMQLETLDLLARKANHQVQARALITLYRRQFDFVKAVTEEIRRHLSDRCFKTMIRFSVKLSEAAAHGVPVGSFSVHSAGCADYRALANEVLEQELPQELPQEVSKAPSVSPEASTPVEVGKGVLFTIEAPGAHCVQVAGDFNGWIPEKNEMQSNGGLWSTVIPLQPGRYHYRFVVDGDWLSDPLNIDVEPAPWGGYNSVLDLKANNPHMET